MHFRYYGLYHVRQMTDNGTRCEVKVKTRQREPRGMGWLGNGDGKPLLAARDSPEIIFALRFRLSPV